MKKERKAISLKTTLALFFFALSAVVLLISGIVQIAAYYQIQQETVASKQNFIASDVTGQVINFIQTKLVVMEAIGASASIASDSQAKLTQILDGLLGLQKNFRHVALLDKSGKLITGASRYSQSVFAQFISLLPPDLMKQMQTNAHYISKVYLDELNSEPKVIIATAEKSGLGEVRSVIVCEITLKFMWDLMSNLTVGKSGYAYVVDRSGTMLAFKDPALVLKKENVSKIKTVDDFLKNKSVTKIQTYKGVMGAAVVGKYVPLKTPDWAVIIELPVQEAFQEVWKNVIITAIITLTMAFLSGFIGLYLARRIALPLVNLTTTATRIAEGDTHLQATVTGSKEIATLASTFNSMTTQLNNKVGGFKHMNALLTEIIARAKELIINLNSTTKEIASASQEQTSASNESASGIREVSATLQELTITAKQITKNVGDLVFSSEEVIKLLKESESQLLDTVTQLGDAGTISKNNTAQISELGKRSMIINEMVELIKQIANKTNILSINASIEASRLGQTNSGFSVVASEIRLLSKETIESSKKAEAAAKDIHKFLNSIIVSSESESKKVVGSEKTVKTVFDNVEQIVSRINNNYTFTQRIDVSIKQQEHGSIQAAETIRQMAEIARQSAKISQETLTAVKDIVTLGQNLGETVMKFTPENQE